MVYEIAKIEVLNPEEVNRMKNSPYDLSLYSCTYSGSQRITVRANRIQ